ncbi:hypothetical protein WJX74_005820 [Apatococcus lobatus]|uniref:Uncharacterized protein n=1 Tax=Apatococcus lobatus TaxID=904363 RepID=A0AAW1RTJ9_9CHLO
MTQIPAYWCWDRLQQYKSSNSDAYVAQNRWASNLLEANNTSSITAAELSKRLAHLEAVKKKVGKKDKTKVNKFLMADQSGIFDPSSTFRDWRWALHPERAVQHHADHASSMPSNSQKRSLLPTPASTTMCLRRAQQSTRPSQPERCGQFQSESMTETNLHRSVKGLKSAMRKRQLQNEDLADELDISREALQDMQTLCRETRQELQLLQQYHKSTMMQHHAMEQDRQSSRDVSCQLASQQVKVADLQLELANTRQNEAYCQQQLLALQRDNACMKAAGDSMVNHLQSQQLATLQEAAELARSTQELADALILLQTANHDLKAQAVVCTKLEPAVLFFGNLTTPSAAQCEHALPSFDEAVQERNEAMHEITELDQACTELQMNLRNASLKQPNRKLAADSSRPNAAAAEAACKEMSLERLKYPIPRTFRLIQQISEGQSLPDP